MKRQLLFMVLALTGALFSVSANTSEGLPWTTSMDEAKQQAASSGKPIMALFTGSDWCPYCIKLESEVLNTSDFVEQVQDHFVFLYVDFPRKTALTPEHSKRNEALKSQFNIRAVPSVLLLTQEGSVMGKTGYQPGGPDAFIATLNTLLDETDQIVARREETTETVEEVLAEATEEATTEEVAEVVEECRTDDVAEVTEEVTTEEVAEVTEEVTTEEVAEVTEEVATEEVAEVTEEVATEEVAEVTEEVATEEVAEVAEEVTTEEVAEVAEEVTTEEVAEVTEETTTEEVAEVTVEETTEEVASEEVPEVEEVMTEEIAEVDAA